MILYVVRHAKAVERNANLPDEKRYLTKKGRLALKKVPQQIIQYGPSPDVIITSPLVRAVQTAEILATDLKSKTSLVVSELLRPGANLEVFIRFLKKYKNIDSVLVVGHEPYLSLLIAKLLKQEKSINLKKAACIALDISKNHAALIPNLTPMDKFRDAFISQWQGLQNLQRKVLKKAVHEDIHDLRIALRRFRLMLNIYEILVSKSVKGKFKKDLKRLIKKLGTLRDIDEAIIFFNAKINIPAKHQFYKSLMKKRSVECHATKKALKAFVNHHNNPIKKMLKELKARVYTFQCKQSLMVYFSHLSQQYSRIISKLLMNAATPNQQKTRHALRIAVRKWRYNTEIFATILNRDYISLISHLKNFQSILGRLNDLVAFNELSKQIKLAPRDRDALKKCLLLEQKKLLKKLASVKKKPQYYIEAFNSINLSN